MPRGLGVAGSGRAVLFGQRLLAKRTALRLTQAFIR